MINGCQGSGAFPVHVISHLAPFSGTTHSAAVGMLLWRWQHTSVHGALHLQIASVASALDQTGLCLNNQATMCSQVASPNNCSCGPDSRPASIPGITDPDHHLSSDKRMLLALNDMVWED